MRWFTLCAALVVVLQQVETMALSDDLKDKIELAEEASQQQAAKVQVKKTIEQARKVGESLRLPENIHAQEGQEAARQTAEKFKSPVFQEKLRCQQAGIQGSSVAPEKSETMKADSTLATQESVYLFLSSSMPEIATNRYLADIAQTGDQRILPVMLGLPTGTGGQRGNANYFSQVMKEELSCKDKPETHCQRFQVPVRINPVLFTKYGVTQVPVLVYDNGQDFWSIQGDAEFASLLEKVGKAAKSTALTRISTRLRGGH